MAKGVVWPPPKGQKKKKKKGFWDFGGVWTTPKRLEAIPHGPLAKNWVVQPPHFGQGVAPDFSSSFFFFFFNIYIILMPKMELFWVGWVLKFGAQNGVVLK
jgi:hypothetical protein